MQQLQSPLTFVLIGATGDLSKKKILPALYRLHRQGLLAHSESGEMQFSLIGNGRTQHDDASFRQFVHDVVQPADGATWKEFAKSLHYVQGSATEAETLQQILDRYQELNQQHDCSNILWHFSILPKLYVPIIENFPKLDVAQCVDGWMKIMLEKPFGTDLKSARELNTILAKYFNEDQIYRIDHYLAKETVQNILAFRFANDMFEYIWNKDYIEHIEITALETQGIAGRENFYDDVGAVRDVIQNHALQMLATSIMEEPNSLSANDIRDKRHAAIDSLSLRGSVEESVSLGQFESYRTADAIPDDSTTETAAALALTSSLPHMQGVPLYIRAGKKLARDVTEISVQFKQKKNKMFADLDAKQLPMTAGNVLTLRIKPNEGIVIRLGVKKPGLDLELEETPMQFCYSESFTQDLVAAYQKVIYDAIAGNQTLFPRQDGIEASWRLVQPVLEYMSTTDFSPEQYADGTWGPDGFGHLTARDSCEWIEPSVDVCTR